MGQYAGFVTRYDTMKGPEYLYKMEEQGITEVTCYPELNLMIGVVKGDSDGHALTKLLLCGFTDIRMLGQVDSPGDDFPREADLF